MGDGVTDDAKAIQLAFNAAESISQSLSEVNQARRAWEGFAPTLPYSFLMGTTT
jgi:hypothetical protein